VHPGYAKDKMINAGRVAAEFISTLPANETPETTTEYEGFFHLLAMEGGVEKASATFIIRDHDRQKFEARKQQMTDLVAQFNAKYGEGVVKLALNDQYYNMREKVEPQMHIIDTVKQAMLDLGITPQVRAIRGGTDGAQLSFMGLPCPNIFAGGLNFHGPHEFLPIPNLEKASQVVVKIIELTAKA
jgi:tripeptide aminopeptidase